MDLDMGFAPRSSGVKGQAVFLSGKIERSAGGGQVSFEQRFAWSNANTPGRIRTCDSRFRKAVLYPLSYEGVWFGG